MTTPGGPIIEPEPCPIWTPGWRIWWATIALVTLGLLFTRPAAGGGLGCGLGLVHAKGAPPLNLGYQDGTGLRPPTAAEWAETQNQLSVGEGVRLHGVVLGLPLPPDQLAQAQRCPGAGWHFGPAPAGCAAYAGSGPCCHRGLACTSACRPAPETPPPPPTPAPEPAPPSREPALEEQVDELAAIVRSLSVAVSAAAARACGAEAPTSAQVDAVLEAWRVEPELREAAGVALAEVWAAARCLLPPAQEFDCGASRADFPPGAEIRTWGLAVVRHRWGAAVEAMAALPLARISDDKIRRLLWTGRRASHGCDPVPGLGVPPAESNR